MSVLCDVCGSLMDDGGTEGPVTTEVTIDQWEGGAVLDGVRSSLFCHVCPECFEPFKEAVRQAARDELKFTGGN